MDGSQIVRQAWLVLEPQIEELGYELVEVEYAGSHSGMTLSLYLDKPGVGITHEDCTIVARVLSPLLDLEDFIPGEYMLAVSSPGIDRPLRKVADFARFAGEEIHLLSYAPVEGRKRFEGILTGITDDMVGLECDGRQYNIHLENLKKAKLNR